jgi:hypothetical protein
LKKGTSHEEKKILEVWFEIYLDPLNIKIITFNLVFADTFN